MMMGWPKTGNHIAGSATMKEPPDEREAGLKAELQRLKGQRKTLKEDMKKLKRELNELKGSTPNTPLDRDDDQDDDQNDDQNDEQD